jgi:hypothetical protein
MRPSASRSASGSLLLLAAFSACSVDGRSLSYEYHALDAAGASTTGGNEAAGSQATENAGDDSASAGGEGGVMDNTSGGTPGGAGSPIGLPSGDSGSSSDNGGTTTGGATASAGATAAGATGGDTTTAGASPGGGTFVGPCGDLNHDLVDDCSQTLVQNSRFDTTATGWDAESSLTPSWSPSDASNKSSSGSILLDNTAAAVQALGSIMIGAHQCIPTAPGTDYDVAAHIMLAAGQSGGAGGIDVWMFDDGACQGNLVSAHTPIQGGIVGQWTALLGKLSVPAGVNSLSVRLVAIKPFIQAELKVSIDDVLVAKAQR